MDVKQESSQYDKSDAIVSKFELFLAVGATMGKHVLANGIDRIVLTRMTTRAVVASGISIKPRDVICVEMTRDGQKAYRGFPTIDEFKSMLAIGGVVACGPIIPFCPETWSQLDANLTIEPPEHNSGPAVQSSDSPKTGPPRGSDLVAPAEPPVSIHAE